MLVEIMNYSSQALGTVECVLRSLIGLASSDTRHYDLRRITDAATRADLVE